ncbi:efflux RND transporter periplasmic adaptor subunit [Pigmentiphaga litoralis]|nr:HlyD family efflux transporter periplasmic adaptor subunit [Pigmentiphaga litoralis]
MMARFMARTMRSTLLRGVSPVTRLTWLGAVLGLMALGGLAGCSDGASAAPTAQTAGSAAAAPSGSNAAASGSNAAAASAQVVAIARGKVDIDGGLLDIAAMADGQVTHVAVKPGDAVKRGQVLVQLSEQSAQLDLALADAELQRATAVAQSDAARVPAARDLARRLASAAALGATDRQRADDAAATVQQLEAAVRLSRADAAIQKQKRAQAAYALAQRTIHAPQSGRVAAVSTQAGAWVRAGQAAPLLVIVPDRPLIVRAELNESYAARVKPGMRADVTLESNGRQQALPARLIRIAQTYGASQLYDDTQPRAAVRVIECVLEFDQPPALRIGQTVRVNFHE